MMTLIDKISVLMDEITAATKEEAKEMAMELLALAGQVDDYELAIEIEDTAWRYLK